MGNVGGPPPRLRAGKGLAGVQGAVESMWV